MSFTRVHTVEKMFGDTKAWLGVYADGSALLLVGEDYRISLASDDTALDILLLGDDASDALQWVDNELRKGRSK
jgi:hypothetical protein